MIVKDFLEFSCISNIILKDPYTTRVYTKLKDYLDKEITGFYPRFDPCHSNDSYNPYMQIQILALLDHDKFDKDVDPDQSEVESLAADHLSVCAPSMTVTEFRQFCDYKDIVLRNCQTGRIYSKLDNYLEHKIIGFYPRFAVRTFNDDRTCAFIEIVAWI